MEKSSSMQRGISPFVDIFEVDPDPSSFVIEKIGHQKTVVYLWGKKNQVIMRALSLPHLNNW